MKASKDCQSINNEATRLSMVHFEKLIKLSRKFKQLPKHKRSPRLPLRSVPRGWAARGQDGTPSTCRGRGSEAVSINDFHSVFMLISLLVYFFFFFRVFQPECCNPGFLMPYI